MLILDMRWALPVNVLTIQCDCKVILEHPSNYSVVVCPICGRKEMWHSVDPKPGQGPWSLPVMNSAI